MQKTAKTQCYGSFLILNLATESALNYVYFIILRIYTSIWRASQARLAASCSAFFLFQPEP